MNFDETVAKLFGQINRDNIVRSLHELIAAKSVNPFDDAVKDGYGEKKAAEYYAAKMAGIGFDVHTDTVAEGRLNVFGRLKGTGEKSSLMLAGHLDTVDAEADAFQPKTADGKVFGRGACDMKGALAIYLEVGRLIVASGLKLKGDLILGGIADEEYKMIGSLYVDKHGPKAGQCIIGEPTELKVCPVNKGHICLYVKTFGRSVHSSVPEEGVSAIEKMMKAVAAFGEYHKKLRSRPPHPLCGTASFCSSVIKGGSLATAVADYCELEVDRRILPGETKETVYSEIREILEALAADDPDFKYELSAPTFDIKSNEISENEPVVPALLEAYGQVTGLEKVVYGLPFGTDAPNMGCPAVVCGPGSISQAHSADEYVEIDQLEKAAQIYLAAVVRLLT